MATMNLPLPEDVQAQLQSFEELLDSLERKLQPFTAPGAATSISQMEPLERAQTHLALAGAAFHLFELLLQANGVDDALHEGARKEQERLRLYAKKVRKVAAERELKESKRSLEVNVAAVNRFISAAVPDLSKEQKAALREAGAAAAGAGTRGRGEGQGEAADAAAAFLQGTMAELQGAPEQGGGGKRRKTGGSKR